MKNPAVSNTDTSLNNLYKGGYPYAFRLVNKNKLKYDGKLYDHIYTFNNIKGYKYYANCIEYEIGVYAVKFHLKIHQKHSDRYKKITNFGDAIPILKTIVGIMLDILKKDEFASFAFIGMSKHNEGPAMTKRYCIYREFCMKYFSTNSFDHFYDEDKSFYMILNKKTDTTKKYKDVARVAEEEFRTDSNSRVISLGRSTG